LILCYDIANQFYHLAKECQQENKIEEATTYYKQALYNNTQHLRAALDAAQMLYGANKVEEALTFYQHALKISDNYPEVHYNIGLCFFHLSNTDEAIRAFKKAVRKNPQYIKAYIKLGTAYANQKKFHKAIQLYQKALDSNPDSYELYYCLGNAFRSIENYENAIDALEKALNISPANPTIMIDLANTLHMVDEYERALELYQKSLDINPQCLNAAYNVGYTLKQCGDITNTRALFERSIELHTKTIELRPDYAMPHFSCALSYLTLGNFELGWPEYEYRWQAYNETPKQFAQPTWEGQSLEGKRILLYAEQGFGDTFQFIRYGKVLKDMGAHVIVQTQHRLKNIISLCPYLDEVVSDREQLPPFDYHIALMSIPMVLKTTVETVPSEIPYLHAKEELCKEWEQKLVQDKKLKVGICWQGNKQYRSTLIKKVVADKSIGLETFKPLASIPNVSLYSLQKVNGTEQLDTVEHMDITTFGTFDEDAGPFMDTAAIIKHLDLVITIDTSIGHLAAGLGADVWIILPFPADWRWLLDRNDTPWYPNVKLFRQPERGDWKSVMSQVVKELEHWSQSHNVITDIKSPIVGTKKKYIVSSGNLSDAPSNHNDTSQKK